MGIGLVDKKKISLLRITDQCMDIVYVEHM